MSVGSEKKTDLLSGKSVLAAFGEAIFRIHPPGA
jgi:hypothetical protein